MKRTITRLFLLMAAPLALGGCAGLLEAADSDDCRPAGPQDPAAPGEWICDEGGQDERTLPRHRVEDDG